MQLTCAAGDDLRSSCCRLDSVTDQNRHDLSSIQRRPQTALQSANMAYRCRAGVSEIILNLAEMHVQNDYR